MKAGLHRTRATPRTEPDTRSGPARRLGLRVTGFVAAIALAITLASPVSPAMAIDYPSWDDLQNAKSNTASAANQVAQIQNAIAGLQAEVSRTQAEAEARGLELQVAQEKFDDATLRASDLQTQADDSKTQADAATRQAGQLAAQLYRTGGTDLSVNLFIDGQESGEGADVLLSKLGSMSKLVERSTDVYDQAQTANNTAQSLGDQAAVAQAERETLRIAAEAAMAVAQQAADAAAGALAESEAKSIELEAQLQFMQDAEATTAAAYQAGVIERARIAAEAAMAAAQTAADAAAGALAESEAKGVELEAQLQFMQDAEATTAAGYQAGVIERARIAAEEAERSRRASIAAAAAAAAAATASARPSSGSSGAATGTAGAGLQGGRIGGQGWAVPAGGRITAGYGPRAVLCGGGACSGGYHYASDIGTGCSAPIYAASTGTVVYAGSYGTYGNFVLINHGNGVETGYAHIRPGGIFVSVGQRVDVGQNIASSGTTGASTGCHLHFEVRTGGNRINPASFMSDRGAPIG